MNLANSLQWDEIWQDLGGQPTYHEVTAEFLPYTSVERYQDSEQELWSDIATAFDIRQIYCQLGRRYCSHCHNAWSILQSESPHTSESQ